MVGMVDHTKYNLHTNGNNSCSVCDAGDDVSAVDEIFFKWKMNDLKSV